MRFHVEYQLSNASNLEALQSVTEAVLRVLSKHYMVKQPVQGILLADPYCADFANSTCQQPYPDFTSPFAPDRQCVLADINPAHVANLSSCLQRVAVPGANPSYLCNSMAGDDGLHGEAVDMYLYVTAHELDDCDQGNGGTAAIASACLLDLATNRPLLGSTNVCPYTLLNYDRKRLVEVLVHEMLHALGFDYSVFEYGLTLRPDGSARPSSETLTSVLVGGLQTTLLATPRVVQAAQEHFGCPSLQGAALEDEGGAGSALSHWEYNLFQGDVLVAMSPASLSGAPAVVSPLTLAFLDDSGWYVANWSMAGNLAWGKGAGCDLPLQGCWGYMDGHANQTMFCDPETYWASGTGKLCSSDYRSYGWCYDNVFSNSCGMVWSPDYAQACSASAYATYDSPDAFGWGAGTSAGRCVPATWPFEAVPPATNASANSSDPVFFPSSTANWLSAACFDMTCSPDGKMAYLQVLGRSLECPEGEYLDLPALLPGHYLQGRVGPCPPAHELCGGLDGACPQGCNAVGGDCVGGSCRCRLSFTGRSCSWDLLLGPAPLEEAVDTDEPGQPIDTMPSANTTAPSTKDNDTASSLPPLVLSPLPSPVPAGEALGPSNKVQLSFSLDDAAASVANRSSGLVEAVASWLGLQSSNITILAILPLADQPQSGNTTSAPKTAPAASPSRHLLIAGQPRLPSGPWGDVIVATADTGCSVIFLATMSSTKDASVLAVQLASGSPGMEQGLTDLLTSQGFAFVAGSLAATVLGGEPTGAIPPQEPLTQDDTSSSGGQGAGAHNSGLSSHAVVAVAAGVAVFGVVALLVVVVALVVRRRSTAGGTGSVAQYSMAPAAPAVGMACDRVVVAARSAQPHAGKPHSLQTTGGSLLHSPLPPA